MPREIKMPKLSDTMEEGTINVWRKGEGEVIAKGDILVEIETDKADMEFEAYMAGTLAKILVPAGETVAVGVPIAVVRLDRDGDAEVAEFLAGYGATAAAAAAPQPAAPSPAPAPAAAAPAAPAPVAAAPAAAPVPPAPVPTAIPFDPAAFTPTSKLPFYLPDPDRVRATPRARVLAQERSVDLSEIAGSGPEGAVRVHDVERYLEALETAEPPLVEGDVAVTPVAARIAEELRVDLSRLKGTGPGGRITKRDIREHLEREASGDAALERSLYGDEIKLSQKRKFLIGQMVDSKKEVPHFYLSTEVDVEPLRALRERIKRDGKRVTYTHFIVKATALALERFPEVNVTYQDGRILRYALINVAVAVDVQGELVAPVVKNCQGRELEDLARATDSLIERARERKLRPEDYSDGTISISNLGMFGVDHFYAIITPPQSTVLSVGALREVPVADGAEVRSGLRMTFGLGVDHRVLDGARAAQFLAEIRRLLENPEELAAAPGTHGD